MSETAAFPFDSASSPNDEAEAGPDRRKLIVFIVLGVVLSALAGYFLVFQVFGGADLAAPSTITGTTSPAPVAGGAPSASPASAPVQQGLLGPANRNPFIPLIVQTQAAAAPTPTPSAAAAPTPTPSAAAGG